MRRIASIIPLFLILSVLFSFLQPVRADDTWMMNTASAGVGDISVRKASFESAYDPQALYYNSKYYFAYTGGNTTAYVWVLDDELNYAGRYDISPGWRISDICVFRAGEYVYAAVGKYTSSSSSGEYMQVSIYRLRDDGVASLVSTANVGDQVLSGYEYTTRVYPVRDSQGSAIYLIFASYCGSLAGGMRVALCNVNNGFSTSQIYSANLIGSGQSGRLWGYYSNNTLYWFDGRNFFKYEIGGTAVKLDDRSNYPNGQILTHVVYYGGDSNYIFRFYIQNDNNLIMLQEKMSNGNLNSISYTLRSDVKNILKYQWNTPQSSYLDTIIVQTTDNLMVAQSVTFDSFYNYYNTSSTIMSQMTTPLINFNPLRIAYTQSGTQFYVGLYSSQSQFIIKQAEGCLAPPTPLVGGSGAIETINATSNRKLLFYRELDNAYDITYIAVQISANASGTVYAYAGSNSSNMSLFGTKTFLPGNRTITVLGNQNGTMVAVLFKFNDNYQLNYSCATYSSSVLYTDNNIVSYLSLNLSNFVNLSGAGNPLIGVSVFIPPTDNRTGYVGEPGGGGAGGQYFNYTLWLIVNNMSQPNNYDINRNNTIPSALQGVKQMVEGYGMPWSLFGLIVFAACCFTAAFSLAKHNVADPRLILFFVTILGYVLFAAGVVDFVVPALCTIALIGVSAMAVAKQFGGGGGE